MDVHQTEVEEFCSPYLFCRGKRARVDAVALLVKLEGRDDESRESAAESLHDLGRLEHAGPKVGAEPEIDVEHHDVLRRAAKRIFTGQRSRSSYRREP